jgi:hypothetical protein
VDQILPNIFVFSLDFSEISDGRRVKCFRKFPNGEGLNCLLKFTGQGTCSHIHSEVFLGNMRCFWDSAGGQCECTRGGEGSRRESSLLPIGHLEVMYDFRYALFYNHLEWVKK